MLHFDIGDKLPSDAKLYRKKVPVLMVKVKQPFTCTSREGYCLQAQVGDYLAEDGHGGFYPISAEFHAANYELVDKNND